MADTKKATPSGKRPGAGVSARRRTAKEAGRRGGGEAVAEAPGRGGDAAGKGTGAAPEAARERTGAASAQAEGAAKGAEKPGRGLAGMAEEAAAGMGSLIAPPDSGSGGAQDAQQAVSRMLESVAATNVRFADALLRRAGPGAVAELQGRFLREYFDALALGGAVLLRAAKHAAEGSLRPFEGRARGAGGEGRRGASGRVADAMRREVRAAGPDDTVRQAARAMAEQDTGVLPVAEDGRLVGTVTDRDLAVRVLAAGMDPAETRLRQVMSGEPRHVFEDEAVEEAAARMAEQRVQSLPVLDRDKRLVGIVRADDLAGAGGVPRP